MKKICSVLFLLFSCMIDATPHLTIIGNVNIADGIGKQSIELIEAFEKEFLINFIHTRKPNYVGVPKQVSSILQKPFNEFGKVVLLEDLIWDPYPTVQTYEKLLSSDRSKCIRLAYSMSESDAIAPEWVEILNAHFDAVAVPDSYLVEVYTRCGVAIPVFELPLGLNLDPFLKRPLKERRNRKFVFGYFSFIEPRKNHLKLVEAFAKTFKNNPSVELKIHARGADGVFHIDKQLKDRIAELDLKNVSLHIGKLSREEYIKLFTSIDCYVTTSKGEGFSIQPREAMALGIPVIATDCTAQSTICATGLVRSISAKIPTPAYYIWAQKKVGNFFDCSTYDVCIALKDVYKNYRHYLSNGSKARRWVTKFSYANLKPRYRNFLNPENIQMGDQNIITDDAIVTTSEDFYQKCSSLFSQ